MNTTTKYYFFHCTLQYINCRKYWRMERTLLGSCIMLDPQIAYDKERERAERNAQKNAQGKSIMPAVEPNRKFAPAHSIKELQLTVAYNKSDVTFGWNGFNNALKLYYLSNQETRVTNDHAYPLVGGLNPSVMFSLVETKLLGKPFTDCNPNVNYTQRSCLTDHFINKVTSTCGCYPSYDVKNFELTGMKACNFFEQATCVATLQNKFDETEFTDKCLPSCDHTSIHQESIHYTRMDKAQADYFRSVASKGTQKSNVNMSELELITTTLKVAEMSKVVYEELPNYTKEELLADIGGALGLILGLNVLDVLVFSGALMKRITFALGMLCRFGRNNYCRLHRMCQEGNQFSRLSISSESAKIKRHGSKKHKTSQTIKSSYTINLKTMKTRMIEKTSLEETSDESNSSESSNSFPFKPMPDVMPDVMLKQHKAVC